MLTRLRWSTFGLRGRIVGLVLVTTVATLLVAAVGLLPRLDSQLRQAALKTLRTDVKTHQGELGTLASLHYPGYSFVSVLSGAGNDYLFRADRGLKDQSDGVVQSVTNAYNALQNDLGATQLILFAFIDSSGQGRPVLPAGPASKPGSNPFIEGSAALVATAFHTDKRSYSFKTIGSTEYVRTAIPLPHADAVLVAYKSIDEIPDAVSAVRSAFTLAAVAGLLLTLLLAIPMTATLVRRLHRLRQAALRVAVAGTGVGFPVDRARDEVGDLARSFAIMQRRLRHQEEARRAFVATASHELRTPLASLEGMLELLADDLRDEQLDLDDAKALLERARAQSRRLGRLAADLLDLSRIDADIALRSEPVELGELSRAVLAEFELAMGERGVTGVLRDAAVPVWALGDPGSIARILRILLDNALRVAPLGSEVTVTLSGTADPMLSVIDQGPGVAPEERALIFERFKRGRDTGGEAGFGLGLAIGRELAERMGGALVLESAAAPGATFTLTLKPAEAPAADRIIPTVAGV